MRRAIAAIVVVVGLLSIGAGVDRYFHARVQQEHDQAARDRHWNQVQHEATQRRILPGEERPVPAKIDGWTGIVGLIGMGIALSVAGGIASVRCRKG